MYIFLAISKNIIRKMPLKIKTEINELKRILIKISTR